MDSPHLAQDEPSPGSTRRRTPLDVKVDTLSSLVFISEFRLVDRFT